MYLPSPSIQQIIYKRQRIPLICEFEWVSYDFSAGVQLVDFVSQGGVVVAGRGGAGVDAGGAVGGELVDDGFADGLGCAGYDADEAVLFVLKSATDVGSPLLEGSVPASRPIGMVRSARSRSPRGIHWELPWSIVTVDLNAQTIGRK